MIEPAGILYKPSSLTYIVMKKTLADRIRVWVLATGLSVLPAGEVNSGTSYSRQEIQPDAGGSSISYGGRLGIGFNGDLSLGAQLLSSNKAKSLIGKVGLDFILSGADRGEFAASVGVGYLFPRGITSTLEGRYTPNSERPFSLGFGLGYGSVKQDGENGEELGDRCDYSVLQGGFINIGGLCEKRCADTGGTWVNGNCECPKDKENKYLAIDGNCIARN